MAKIQSRFRAMSCVPNDGNISMKIARVVAKPEGDNMSFFIGGREEYR